MTFDFTRLSRDPDLSDENLFAYDATDRLLLDTAAPIVTQLVPAELVVIGDRHGALTLGAIHGYGARGVRVFQDPVLGEYALAANAERLGGREDYTQHALDAALLRDAKLVIMQLPRALDALRELAHAIAAWADPGVTVLAGGRVKHMTHRMNDVLGEYFGRVQAGLARQKSRVLTATGPVADVGEAPFPRWGSDPELPFQLAAFGATFGGPTLDHGSRLLLRDLDGAAPSAQRIVDLGCGNGVLATRIARARPAAAIIATDQSWAAVQATRLTAERAEVSERITVLRGDGPEHVPDEWADLIVLNPPFHSGATVHQGVAHRLIEASSRPLKPGGELRVVFNSHLRYRSVIERAIGPVTQIARDRSYTVLSALKQA